MEFEEIKKNWYFAKKDLENHLISVSLNMRNGFQTLKIINDLLVCARILFQNMNTTMYSCTTDLALLKKDYDALLYRMIVVKFNEGIGVYAKGDAVV